MGSRSDVNLFGVFDGHGGSFAAQFVENKLHDKIVQTNEWQQGVRTLPSAGSGVSEINSPVLQSLDPQILCGALHAAALALDEELREMPNVSSIAPHRALQTLGMLLPHS